ncbi:MAG: anthranilate phosphoribosyltransferase [Oscillospiraceae bacterium]|nr:anthranilate phosphoribosyltransferase [Oscillospiraceae bacterium]MDY2847192.1 anthranilate phosphoribosyltransferase [Oscillospiraceae bacterium]
MINDAIRQLINKEDLSSETVEAVMDEIMSGNATQAQMAAYLAALEMKGETIEEITASAKGMRKAGTTLKHEGSVFEIVGTGGDRSNSFNISTTASLVIAASGVKVAKHGNRAASSKSGAADCLEALGVHLMLEPEKNEKVLEECGICFLFAQKYHSAMRFVGPVRKELGVRTVFNILGPLTNPAAADIQVMGVYDEALLEPMAQVLTNLGVNRGMVVYGTDSLDEVSISAPTKVCEFGGGNYKTYTITPEDFGLKTADKSEILGGTGAENAEITKGILKGEIKGAKRDVVLLNAACGLYVTGKASSIADGVKLAAELIDSGKALAKLDEFVAATNK